MTSAVEKLKEYTLVGFGGLGGPFGICRDNAGPLSFSLLNILGHMHDSRVLFQNPQ